MQRWKGYQMIYILWSEKLPIDIDCDFFSYKSKLSLAIKVTAADGVCSNDFFCVRF